MKFILAKLNATFLLLCGSILFLVISQNCWADDYSNQHNSIARKQIIGAIEKVRIDNKLQLDAKVDTGAAISSLSAVNITPYHINQQLWVRFDVSINGGKDKFTFTKPVLRFMPILKRKDEDALNKNKYALRPVIELPLCLGKQVKTISFNLVDRSDFRYSVLLGKNALKQFHLVVDVEENYLIPPECR